MPTTTSLRFFKRQLTFRSIHASKMYSVVALTTSTVLCDPLLLGPELSITTEEAPSLLADMHWHLWICLWVHALSGHFTRMPLVSGFAHLAPCMPELHPLLWPSDDSPPCGPGPCSSALTVWTSSRTVRLL